MSRHIKQCSEDHPLWLHLGCLTSYFYLVDTTPKAQFHIFSFNRGTGRRHLGRSRTEGEWGKGDSCLGSFLILYRRIALSGGMRLSRTTLYSRTRPNAVTLSKLCDPCRLKLRENFALFQCKHLAPEYFGQEALNFRYLTLHP